MRLLLLLILFSLIAGTGAGQTKKIAYESHSGSAENFLKAISDDFFDSDESDFGLPAKEIHQYRLDSVILLSDSVAIIITRDYSRDNYGKDSLKFIGVKRDTVLNDPLFSRKHALDSIRTVIAKDHYYMNSSSIRKVKFVGYDNSKPTSLKKHSAPLVILLPKGPGNGPTKTYHSAVIDAEAVRMLAFLFGLSLLGAFLTWKYYSPRFQKA